jgi:trk system potassium uptake protein TrkA
MLVVIAGGGCTGSHLAVCLLGRGHAVRLIEGQADTLAGLHRELLPDVVFEGNPTDPATLVAAGIEQAQVLAAVPPTMPTI